MCTVSAWDGPHKRSSVAFAWQTERSSRLEEQALSAGARRPPRSLFECEGGPTYSEPTLLGNHAQEISPVGEGLLRRILGRVQRHAIREPEQTFTGRMRRIAAPLVLPCRDAPSSIDVMRREA